MQDVQLILHLALRSLLSHRVKNLVIGLVLAAGASMWMIGNSLVDSIEKTMRESIVTSIAGDLQMYAADAEDPLSIFGSAGLGQEDIGELRDFPRLKSAVASIDNVAAVVPMGWITVSVQTESELDTALAALRAAITQGDGNASADAAARVRRALTRLREDLTKAQSLADQDSLFTEEIGQINQAEARTFWDPFFSDPLARLEWLDTEIAPLSPKPERIFLRLVGTDIDDYLENFPRFRLLEGKKPDGDQSGIWISKRIVEDQLQVKSMRDFQRLHEQVVIGSRSMADDPALMRVASNLRTQASRLLSSLSIAEEQKVVEILEGYLHRTGSSRMLLEAYFTLHDENIDERYRFFIDHLREHLHVYAFEVGDVITLRSFSQSGYPRAVNVTVRGVYTFDGLENSRIAGSMSLVDLDTFQLLYGRPTKEMRAEIAEIKARAKIEVLPQEDAESILFGGKTGSAVDAAQPMRRDDAREPASHHVPARRRASAEDGQTKNMGREPAGDDEETVLSAAILLHDPSMLEDTRAKIVNERVGADQDVQVVSWQEAAGLVGQFILVIRVVFFAALSILFLVAVAILNNAMVISTLERVPELGTLRALGTQRGWIRGVIITESFVLTLVSCGVGLGLSWVVHRLLSTVGIPATSDVFVFLFGGDVLYPEFAWSSVGSGFLLLFVLSLISSLYPAQLAARISPVVAMQPMH